MKGVGKGVLLSVLLIVLLSSSIVDAQTKENIFPESENGEDQGSFESTRTVSLVECYREQDFEFFFFFDPGDCLLAPPGEISKEYPTGWNGTADSILDVASLNSRDNQQTDGDLSFDVWYQPPLNCQLNHTLALETGGASLVCIENATTGFFGFVDFRDIVLPDNKVEVLYDVKRCDEIPEKDAITVGLRTTQPVPYGVAPVLGRYRINFTFFDSNGAYLGDVTNTRVAQLDCSSLDDGTPCSQANTEFEEVKRKFDNTDFLPDDEELNMTITITSKPEDNLENNANCITFDNFRVFALEDDELSDVVEVTEFDLYVNNMTTFTGAPCHGVGSENCGTPDGSGFTVGTHSFQASRRADGVLLGKSVITTGIGVGVGGFPVITIDYLDGETLTVPIHSMNVSNGGRDPSGGTCSPTPCVIENIFPMPNATWIDDININPGGSISYLFQPRQLDTGTVEDSVEENEEWMLGTDPGVTTGRLRFYPTLTNGGETLTSDSNWNDSAGISLRNNYPVIFRNFELDQETGIMSFDFYNFNYIQSGSTMSATTLTIDVFSGGSLLTSNTKAITMTAGAGSDTMSGFFGVDLGDSVIASWERPITADYTESGSMPDYTADLNVTFTITPSVIDIDDCIDRCIDFDSDGVIDDLEVFDVGPSSSCERVSVEIDSTSEICTGFAGVFTDETAQNITTSLQGSFQTIGQSIQAIIDLTVSNFDEGSRLLVWISVALLIGFGLLRRLAEEGQDGGPYAIIASNLVFMGGFLLKHSTIANLRMVSGFFVIMYIILSAFVFWWFYRRGTG